MEDTVCNHFWVSSGLWDGWDGTGERRKNTGGPRAICKKCEEKKNFTHEEWKNLPEESKDMTKNIFGRPGTNL